MPSDRRTDALPEHGTIRFPKGEIRVRLEPLAAVVGGTRTDAWVVCLSILVPFRSRASPRLQSPVETPSGATH